MKPNHGSQVAEALEPGFSLLNLVAEEVGGELFSEEEEMVVVVVVLAVVEAVVVEVEFASQG